MGDHGVVKMLDDATARPLEEERQNGVNQADNTANDHGERKF